MFNKEGVYLKQHKTREGLFIVSHAVLIILTIRFLLLLFGIENVLGGFYLYLAAGGIAILTIATRKNSFNITTLQVSIFIKRLIILGVIGIVGIFGLELLFLLGTSMPSGAIYIPFLMSGIIAAPIISLIIIYSIIYAAYRFHETSGMIIFIGFIIIFAFLNITRTPAVVNTLTNSGSCQYILFNEKGRDTCYTEKAVGVVGDSAECGNVEDAERRRYCLYKVALETNNPSLCESLGNVTYQEPGADQCLDALARKTNNINVCGRIKYEYWRHECRQAIASDLQDATICPTKDCEAQTVLTFLYRNREESPKNKRGLCKEFPMSDYGKLICAVELAVEEENVSFCEDVPVNYPNPHSFTSDRFIEGSYRYGYETIALVKARTIRDYCFAAMAFKTRDYSLCESATSSEVLEYCEKVEDEHKESISPY